MLIIERKELIDLFKLKIDDFYNYFEQNKDIDIKSKIDILKVCSIYKGRYDFFNKLGWFNDPEVEKAMMSGQQFIIQLHLIENFYQNKAEKYLLKILKELTSSFEEHKIYKYYKDEYADILKEQKDNDGNNLLTYMVLLGSKKLFKKLVEVGYNPNQLNNNGENLYDIITLRNINLLSHETIIDYIDFLEENNVIMNNSQTNQIKEYNENYDYYQKKVRFYNLNKEINLLNENMEKENKSRKKI